MVSKSPRGMDINVITLGTAGGPQWWREGEGKNLNIRCGISTAIVVGDDVYLVDAGYGAAQQLARAGYSMNQVRAIFLTHLHSDHTADLPSILLFGLYEAIGNKHLPIRILGPASSPIDGGLAGAEGFFGQQVNGVQGMVDHIERAYDADLFDRMEHGLRAGFNQLFTVSELHVPDTGSPAVAEIYRDNAVTVLAAHVDHATMKPALAFRFDMARGSVTISGDTAPCDALIKLADSSDILLHEAINEDWMDAMYPSGVELTPVKQAALIHHQESHSTVREACAVADAANVKHLILHHLVPGNIPTTTWLTASCRGNGKVSVAEDLDVFTL